MSSPVMFRFRLQNASMGSADIETYTNEAYDAHSAPVSSPPSHSDRGEGIVRQKQETQWQAPRVVQYAGHAVLMGIAGVMVYSAYIRFATGLF